MWLTQPTTAVGSLVQELYENVVVDPRQSEPTTASSNSGFSFFIKVSYDDTDFFKAQKRALSEIVAERNKLIHQELALLDTSCIEDYRKLISLLDEQNPRLLAHLEELGWILQSASDGWQALKDFLKSPEYLQYIQSSQTDA